LSGVRKDRLGFWEPAEAEYVERGVGVLYGLVRVLDIRQGEVYG